MEAFIRKIIQLRWLILTLAAAATILLGYQIRNLTINSDILSTLPDDDPTAQLYKKIGNEFGGNDIGMIVLETDNIFTANVLQHIRQITDSIKTTTGVSTVTSLTNILQIKSTEWGIEIGKLVNEYNLPFEQPELEMLKQEVLSNDMYNGAIVSGDGSATIILFTLLPDTDVQDAAKEIKRKVLAMKLTENLYFGGLPFMLDDITQLILSDMFWLIPIVFIIISLVLLFGFRKFRGMLLPLLTAGITVIWTLGLMALTGFEVTIISNIIPVVLVAIGSAYAIHVLNSINIHSGNSKEIALKRAMEYTTIPVVLAAITTAGGFVSFIFGAYLTMIKEFGITTALGILVALLLSVFFVPALISVLPDQQKKIQSEKTKSGILVRHILKPLTKFLFNYPRLILALWGILLLLSTVGISLIKSSVNIADYFEKDNPTRVSEDILQKKFGGSLPTFVLFEGDIKEPELLKLMLKTEQFMKENRNISTANSVADLVEQLNDAMGEGLKIPDEKAKIEQLWFLLDGQDIMAQLVSDDRTKAVIQSKFASIETREIEIYNQAMEEFTEENSTEKISIKFTGSPSLYVKLNDSLVKSQYTSLLTAIIVVLLVVGLIMRSAIKGIYATIPIIVSILVLLGFMGVAGIPLDIATVLVGSIALGIGIDYSIHIISGFNAHLKENRNIKKALENTLATTGQAVIINLVSVAAGFLVLLFAQVVPIQNFGLLIAISMFGSGLGALTLLPVILLLTQKSKSNRNQYVQESLKK